MRTLGQLQAETHRHRPSISYPSKGTRNEAGNHKLPCANSFSRKAAQQASHHPATQTPTRRNQAGKQRRTTFTMAFVSTNKATGQIPSAAEGSPFSRTPMSCGYLLSPRRFPSTKQSGSRSSVPQVSQSTVVGKELHPTQSQIRTFRLPLVTVTLTKRRVYSSRLWARPLGCLGFSCGST